MKTNSTDQLGHESKSVIIQNMITDDITVEIISWKFDWAVCAATGLDILDKRIFLTNAPAWTLQLETWSPTAKGMVFVSKKGGSENLAIVRRSSISYVPLGDERQYSRQWWRTVTWNFLVCTHIYFKDIPIMNC